MNNNLPTPNSKLQTILVTGAKGQLGKKIIELMSKDYKLILTDYDSMDITDESKVNEVFESEKPEIIIHGAAYTQVDKAEENKEICRKVNVLGSANIAKAAKKIGAKVIYISTDYVFDGKKDSPYNEEDLPHPLSVYGMTKYEGEKAVMENCPESYILRSAWIFGELPEGHPGTNFVETMLKLSKEKDELSIVSDQIGSPTYTGDLVKTIMLLAGSRELGVGSIKGKDNKHQTPDSELNAPFGIYHFSGAGAASWYDFAVEIFKQANVKIKINPITSDQYPQKAARPSYSYLDKTKIENALNIKVRPWQEMLADYLSKR